LLVDSNRREPPVRANPELAEFWPDPRLRLIEPLNPPTNAATARNTALSQVKGDWVSYLDDDDEYSAGKLAAQLHLAATSACPLVLCGYTFVWPRGRRRIRQCGQNCFLGDELLFGADFMTSLLLHRRDPDWRLPEGVRSGDDRIATLEFFRHHRINEVPCVTEPLVTVFCQTQSVHKNREAAWHGGLNGLRVARKGNFSDHVRRQFLLSAMIERSARGHGSISRQLALSAEWLRLTGAGGWGFVVYGLVTRSSFVRTSR
jgi:glycosyltransferase involved in cell wall biosynthesis